MRDCVIHPACTKSGTDCQSSTHASAHGGAGIWHHQDDTVIPPILAAWIGERRRRVQSGRDGVEFEANVCVGGVIWSGNEAIYDGNDRS